MLTHRRERIGELDCHVLAAPNARTPARSLVLCHGFGAPGTDLVPLAAELCRLDPGLAADTLFVFPEAPLAPPEFRSHGGRAWWPLDMVRLQWAIERGELRELRREKPERLPAASAELRETLQQISDRWTLPLSRMVLGGFSQGSMLMTDVTLRLPESPAGLVIFSGTLLNEEEWSALAPQRAGLQVLQTHGTDDPILPYEGAEQLRSLLTTAGLDVEFQSFDGGHTIPRAALTQLVDMVRRVG